VFDAQVREAPVQCPLVIELSDETGTQSELLAVPESGTQLAYPPHRMF
jgi:hypothetical protein